ncbi:MAG TPA: hypothetical protein ENJ95_20235 [Bacteroidetes bacterium]|nr:hypothetical protein [Bacteroidota bacterium]
MLQIRLIKAAILAAAFFSSFSAFSQIQFKLHWMEADQQWGVFARLEEGVDLNMYTIVGSGQVTLLAPVGTSFKSLQSVSGEWVQNAFISAPEENPEVDYISFGLVSNVPEIILQPGEETLLFTFAKRQDECPEFLSLIDNKTDPMAKYPNSANANPGNDLSIMDPATTKVYNYTGNYMPKAWDCHPGKAIALNEYRTGKERYRPQVIKP